MYFQTAIYKLCLTFRLYIAPILSITCTQRELKRFCGGGLICLFKRGVGGVGCLAEAPAFHAANARLRHQGSFSKAVHVPFTSDRIRNL